MKRWGAVALVAAGGAVTAAIAWAPVDVVVEPRPGAASNATMLATLAAANPACSLCHYAWDRPLIVEPSGDGARATAASTLAVLDARAVRVTRGDERTSAVLIEDGARVALGQSATFRVHVPEGSTVLFVAARAASDDFSRANLSLALVTPDGREIPADTPPGPVVAVRVADASGIPPGEYAAVVTYADGSRAVEDAAVLVDVAGPGVVPLDGAPEAGSAEWPLSLGDARAVVLTFRPWNAHPTDKWILPNFADLGFYSVLLALGTPAAPRSWSAEDVAAGWVGEDRRVLVDETVSGVAARHRSARGEWTSRAAWRSPPGPEQPFAAIPPGTSRLDARIEWTAATPGSPAPAFYLAYTLPGNPAFLYPEPIEEGSGYRRYRVDVRPDEWEAFEGTGAFQAFALMRLDERGVAAFDGARRLVVEAVLR